jgi:hypothetical protein
MTQAPLVRVGWAATRASERSAAASAWVTAVDGAPRLWLQST